MPGCRGASSGGRGGGGTVGDRIRGLGVSGPRGGGGPGGPIPYGGGGGVATRDTGPYIYIYIYSWGDGWMGTALEMLGWRAFEGC